VAEERVHEKAAGSAFRARRRLATGRRHSALPFAVPTIYYGVSYHGFSIQRGLGCGNTAARPATRDKSDSHFRETATEYDRKPGIKWLSCTAKWQSDTTLRRRHYEAEARRLAKEEGLRPAFAPIPRRRAAALSAAQVRKTPSWPRSRANFALLALYFRGNAWANSHLLGQPNAFLAAVPRGVRRRAPAGHHWSRPHCRFRKKQRLNLLAIRV
jgi:hypothetical protein